MRTRAIAGGAFGLLLLSMSAQAQPRVGESVALSACVRAGVEAGCLIVSAPDGTVFNITGANPKPPREVMIELRGTVSDKLSACNQGSVLDNVSWTATQRRC